jgi:arginase
MRKPATAGNTGSGERIDMIGVPFDGMGRSPGQAGAPQALRAAGLSAVLGPDAAMGPDLVLPGPVRQRAAGSGLLNERALLHMVDTLHAGRRVAVGWPVSFIYGSDCGAARCGSRAGCRWPGGPRCSWTGTRDATPMDLGEWRAATWRSPCWGLTGERAPQPLRDRLPALAPAAIAMLGPRDHCSAGRERPDGSRPGMAALSQRGVPGPARLRPHGRSAHRGAGARWWLHIDLDVLARSQFAACGAPAKSP